MSNIGIIGTSFSTGGDSYTKEYSKMVHRKTKNFVDIFNENDVSNQYYSSSNPGHSTEDYVDSIIFLKRKYNIDKILIEVYRNENLRHIPFQTERIIEVLKITDIEIIEKIYSRKSVFNSFIHSESPLEAQKHLYQYALSEKQEKAWIDVHTRIHSDDSLKIFTTLMDLYKTITLCNMLNIVPYLWKPIDLVYLIPNNSTICKFTKAKIELNKFTKGSLFNLTTFDKQMFGESFDDKEKSSVYTDNMESVEDFQLNYLKLWNNNIFKNYDAKYLNGNNFLNLKFIDREFLDKFIETPENCDFIRQGIISTLVKKYGEKEVLCDGTHLNDTYQEKMIINNMIPFINDKNIKYVL